MKDIGEKLKNNRISTGISVEEAAEDLNYKVSQLEDIENGNYKSFKDKFVLKAIVSDYSKYLGLDVEEIIDQFNDFVFESTSKIPLDEIEKASRIKEKNEDVKIASPYTATEEKNTKYWGITSSPILKTLFPFFLRNNCTVLRKK